MKISSIFGRLIACLSATAAMTASAAPLFGLYNTGVDDTGTLLSAGSIDQHWSGPAAEYAMPGGYGPWTPPNSTSSWLSINPGGDAYLGYYDLSTTFDLTGYDEATVSISGRCATDNLPLGIYVNGHLASGQSCSGFSGWNSFSLTSDFFSGINTLVFQYYNFSHQEGFRAEFTDVSGNALGSAVPEPESLVLAFTALGLMAASSRRRKSVSNTSPQAHEPGRPGVTAGTSLRPAAAG